MSAATYKAKSFSIGLFFLALAALGVSGCGGDGGEASSSASSSSSSSSSSSASSSSSSSSNGGNPSTTVVIEENAKGFCAFDGVIDTQHSGYGGDGFVDTPNEVGTEISWQIASSAAQNVTVKFRYGNGSDAARPGSVTVNGAGGSSATFGVTGAWTSWQEQSVNVALASGTNTVTLTSTSDGGLANLDSISVTGSGISADNCPPEPAAVAINKWFAVVNRESGLAFDIQDMDTENGAALTQWTRGDSDNQLFRFMSSGNDYFRLVAQHSNRALDVMDFNLEDGADIVQWENLNGENQQFQVMDLHNGYYQFVNRLSGKALAPESDSPVAGTRITQYTPDASNEAQQWQLIEVEDYNGATVGGDEGDYYVALDGSDNNPGTIDRPFRNIQKAVEAAGPGDLVLVRGGVYEISSRATSNAGLHFWKSGTSEDNRIRYFAYPGETPVFDFGRMPLLPDPNYTHGILVTGSFIHMKGFEVRNVRMNTRSNVAISVEDDSRRVIFEELDIHHNQGTGMFIRTKRSGGHLILNTDSHDNYDPHSHQGDGQNADGFGVHYQISGEVTVFRGCRAWWNSDDGWDFISQEVPVIVENSWAMGNGYSNSGRDRPASGNGAGFKMGSSKTGIRHVIRNNLAWGNRNQGFYANHSAGGNDWFNNTSYNNGKQFDMWGSTWDSNGNRTDDVIHTGSKVHRLRNNIAFPHNNQKMQGEYRNNTWDLGITPRESDFLSVNDAGTKGPRQPDGSLPDLDFLKLRSGSQMIDKGVDVQLPFEGSAPDLGAYEF